MTHGSIPGRKDAGLYRNSEPSSEEYDAVAESEGASRPYALAAGGLDYTTRGLARICRDGVDSICATVKELEDAKYIIREHICNYKGQLGSIEYTILEHSRPPEPKPGKSEREKPVLDNSVLGKHEQENPAQFNTKESNNHKSKTVLSNT